MVANGEIGRRSPLPPKSGPLEKTKSGAHLSEETEKASSFRFQTTIDRVAEKKQHPILPVTGAFDLGPYYLCTGGEIYP